MKTSNAAYRCHLITHLPALAQQPGARNRLRFLMDRVLALVLVDLEPARPLLQVLYCDRKGGRAPRDPVAMLRSLLLMVLCGSTSINRWAARLKGEPELCILSGFCPQDRPPGVGTFYDFLHRLLDGVYQRRCDHHGRASQRVQGRRFVRHLRQEKEAQKEKTQAQLAQSHQGKVGLLVDKALGAREQGLPQDLEQRLQEILMRCAVCPSAAAGLLGELGRLVVASDGTAIESHANGDGHAGCSCRKEGLSECSCPRLYADPEATWGYDSHRERYYFGYRLHVTSTRAKGDDLPLHVCVAGAHTPDVVMGVESLSRLVKRLGQEDLGARIFAALYDAGYDAGPFYRYHQELSIAPLIPLAQEPKTPACMQGLPRDEQGTPLCPGGLPMRLHQRDLHKQELVYNCPVKRPGREAGKLVMRTREQECPREALCEPDSVMGPLLHIRLREDPRLNLPIPRHSALFTEMFKDRTATERYNSTLKSKGRMARGAYRRQHYVLTVAVLHAIEAHANAWVGRVFAQERPRTDEELLAWLGRGGAGAEQVA